MWPAGPLTSNSKRLALPFQTLLMTEVPSYSTHCFEAVKGCTRPETWVFQVPKLKSKSCWPSRFFGDCSGSAALASDATISAWHKRHGRKYLSKTLFDNVGPRGIELVIDQRLHFFCKLLYVRLADMMIECGLIHPARMNVEQTRILDRTEDMNFQTTRFLLSRRCNDFAQRVLHTFLLTCESVKARKDKQLLLIARFLGIFFRRR